MYNKDTIKKLLKQIEDTRILMHNLITEKQYNLIDLEVVKLSQVLDELLCKYNDLKQ